MPEKHWSEIHKINEVREIKWTISGVLTFWVKDEQNEDYLSAHQQFTFDRGIIALRDSLYLAFPLVSSSSTRLELHRILDEIDIGFKESKSTKAAHLLQQDFEDGIFKYPKKRKTGRPPKRDMSAGDISSAKGMIEYLKIKSNLIESNDFKGNEKNLQSTFSQIIYGVRNIFPKPEHFERRVKLLRSLDHAYTEFERGNQIKAEELLNKFKSQISTKSASEKLLTKLKK